MLVKNIKFETKERRGSERLLAEQAADDVEEEEPPLLRLQHLHHCVLDLSDCRPDLPCLYCLWCFYTSPFWVSTGTGWIEGLKVLFSRNNGSNSQLPEVISTQGQTPMTFVNIWSLHLPTHLPACRESKYQAPDCPIENQTCNCNCIEKVPTNIKRLLWQLWYTHSTFIWWFDALPLPRYLSPKNTERKKERYLLQNLLFNLL